MKAIQT